VPRLRVAARGMDGQTDRQTTVRYRATLAVDLRWGTCSDAESPHGRFPLDMVSIFFCFFVFVLFFADSLVPIGHGQRELVIGRPSQL
jgi:hypothetical protein